MLWLDTRSPTIQSPLGFHLKNTFCRCQVRPLLTKLNKQKYHNHPSSSTSVGAEQMSFCLHFLQFFQWRRFKTSWKSQSLQRVLGRPIFEGAHDHRRGKELNRWIQGSCTTTDVSISLSSNFMLYPSFTRDRNFPFIFTRWTILFWQATVASNRLCTFTNTSTFVTCE